MLIPHLQELVDYYIEYDGLSLDQLFDKYLNVCEAERIIAKYCGIGEGTIFFDIDGKRYPCSFITPMTFTENKINDIMKTDFHYVNNFIDKACYESCYIYPICPVCSGASYLVNGSFSLCDKSKCRIQKLLALFIADLQAKRIQKNPKQYDDTTLYYTIEAIRKIRELYPNEFKYFLP